jgi:hypothetical protein
MHVLLNMVQSAEGANETIVLPEIEEIFLCT